MKLVIADKPSVAMSLAAVLGATERKDGYLEEMCIRDSVYIDEKDKQTVIFAYPHLFTNTATLQVILSLIHI